MNALTQKVHGIIRLTAFCVLMAAPVARAQDAPRRGWETGMDIYSGRRGGEAAFYVGGFGRNGTVAFRFGALEETDTVPCSVGVLYEYVGFRRTAARVQPTAGLSANRIFSCATDGDTRGQQSPAMHGSRLLTAGVRIPIFRGERSAGSFKVMGFTGRMFGQTAASDATTRGIVVGAVIHAP